MFVFDGILINAATVLTTGVFLSGYIVLLGGSDFLVGVLNNSSTWASIASVFSFLIYERMRRRKALLIGLNLFSRLFICLTIFLPSFIDNSSIILSMAAAMIITGSVIWGFYSIGITVMMIGLLPKEMRSQYIYIRMFWLRISFTVTTILMGFVLDLFKKSYTGFLIVFLVSLVFSIADVLTLLKIKEPDYSLDEMSKVDPRQFLEPLRNKKFRDFLFFIFFFYLSLTISTSFTPLYLIRYLNFDYSFISGTNVITYVLMIVCTKFWSKVEREHGLNFVIRVTAAIVVCEVLIYSFLTSSTYYLLFLAPFASGIGYSGFNVAILTYRYDLIPDNAKTVYEGWSGGVLGLSMLISPGIGNILMKGFTSVQNQLLQISNFQLLYLTSSICSALVVYIRLYRNNAKQSTHDKCVRLVE